MAAPKMPSKYSSRKSLEQIKKDNYQTVKGVEYNADEIDELILLKKMREADALIAQIEAEWACASIGEFVKTERVNQKKTQLQIAYLLGYDSMQFVSLFERGLSKIPSIVLGKLIVILKLPEKKVLTYVDAKSRVEVYREILDGKRIARRLKI